VSLPSARTSAATPDSMCAWKARWSASVLRSARRAKARQSRSPRASPSPKASRLACRRMRPATGPTTTAMARWTRICRPSPAGLVCACTPCRGAWQELPTPATPLMVRRPRPATAWTTTATGWRMRGAIVSLARRGSAGPTPARARLAWKPVTSWATGGCARTTSGRSRRFAQTQWTTTAMARPTRDVLRRWQRATARTVTGICTTQRPAPIRTALCATTATTRLQWFIPVSRKRATVWTTTATLSRTTVSVPCPAE